MLLWLLFYSFSIYKFHFDKFLALQFLNPNKGHLLLLLYLNHREFPVTLLLILSAILSCGHVRTYESKWQLVPECGVHQSVANRFYLANVIDQLIGDDYRYTCICMVCTVRLGSAEKPCESLPIFSGVCVHMSFLNAQYLNSLFLHIYFHCFPFACLLDTSHVQCAKYDF